MKGLDKLLEAMSYLRSGSRLSLIVVGGDGTHTPEGQKLLGLARAFGVEDSIAFVGESTRKICRYITMPPT